MTINIQNLITAIPTLLYTRKDMTNAIVATVSTWQNEAVRSSRPLDFFRRKIASGTASAAISGRQVLSIMA